MYKDSEEHFKEETLCNGWNMNLLELKVSKHDFDMSRIAKDRTTTEKHTYMTTLWVIRRFEGRWCGCYVSTYLTFPSSFF